MTYFPELQKKMKSYGVINNSDIQFLKHNMQLWKTYIIIAAAMKNQIKSWNSELFSVWV